MKIVGLEFKEVKVKKFFPSKQEVELEVLFNDGADQNVSKVVNVVDPERTTEYLLEEIKTLVKNAHKESGGELIQDSFVNLVIKEEDKIKNELPQFLTKIDRHLEEISNKKDADGYLDLIRDIKNLKLELI